MVTLDNLFSRIKELKLNAKKVSDDTGISSGNISDWKNGRSMPSAITLDILADYLNCSVDYLLGRTTPEQIANISNVNDNGVAIGHLNGSANIQHGEIQPLTTQEQDLLRIYNEADGKTQTKIMSFIYEIEEKSKS